MKHLKTFESYGSVDMGREEMIGKLCDCGWGREELENMSSEELTSMCMMEDETSHEKEVHEKKWISDAIKRPGSLRRKMHKKKGEKISSSDIEGELSSLRKKDKDPETPGVQGLGKRDLSKYRQLQLAKTLGKMK